LTDILVAAYAALDSHTNQNLESGVWDVSMLGDIPDDILFGEDSIFGIFSG
jgi:hypothetical protein